MKASAPAPLSIAAIRYQRPGSAWAKLCTSASGAARYSSATTINWLAVPSEMKASPARMAPSPTAPAAASAPPAATIVERAQAEFVGEGGKQAPEPIAALDQRGRAGRIDAAGGERLVRPAPRALIEPPGSRRVAHVGASAPVRRKRR